MVPDPEPRPSPPRQLGDVIECDRKEEEEDPDVALRRIYAARKKGSMTEEQQMAHALTEEKKQLIRRRTQTWIGCHGTSVELDEEEMRLLRQACTAMFSTTFEQRRIVLADQLYRLCTLIPPHDRYPFYSLDLAFSDNRIRGLREFAQLLIEDEYESPMDTLIREEKRIAKLDPDNKEEEMSPDDRVSAYVLRARLEGGSYLPVLPKDGTNSAFIRFQEVLAAGPREDDYRKDREDHIWLVKQELMSWVTDESGFDFTPWETINETAFTEPWG